MKKQMMRAIVGLVFLASCQVQATNYYWDANGTTDGAGAKPDGTWGTSAYWNTDLTGGAGSFVSATTTNDDLTIVAGPSATSGNSAFTITVSGSVVAKSLTFQSSGSPTLTGGTSVTLGDGSTGSITVNQYAYGSTAQGLVNFNAPLVLTNNIMFTVNSAAGLTFSAGNNKFTPGAYTMTKLGSGPLKLSNNNGTSITSASTFDVQAGTLVNNNAGAWGTAAIIMNGGNLDADSSQNGQTSSANIHTWNQNWTWFGSAGIFGLGSGGITLGADPIQVTVNQNVLTVGGVIGDGGNNRGLTKAGNGLLLLNGANTYTGTTTVNGGVLRLGNSTALKGGTGVNGGLTALTLNGGVVELAAGDFSRNLGTGSDQFQITGGASGFSSFGAVSSVTVNNNTGQEVQWGSAAFAPSTLVLNETTANAGLEFRNRLDLNSADRTINVNANTAVLSGNIRTSTGTAGLTKGGAGTLVLAGNNTYNGVTTVSAGVLSVPAPASLPNYGTAGKVVFSGGTIALTVGGSGWTTANVDSLLGASTKTSGALGLDTSNGDLTQWTTFTGNLGLTKLGANTLTLNQVNSYSGMTTLSGGTLKMLNPGGASSQSLSGGLTVAGPDVTLMSDNAGDTWTTSFGTVAPTRNAGSTLNIVTTGAGSSIVNLGGAAGFVNNGIYFNGTDFAWRAAANGQVRAPDYGVDSGTSAANALTASTHALMTSDQSFNPGANRTLTSLKMTGGADLTFTANYRLVTSAIVVSGGDSVINLGGAQLQPGTELIIRVDGNGDQLTIPGTINATDVVKSGAGKLIYSGAVAGSPNRMFYVNAGTLEFQSTFLGLNVYIATGATLLYNSSSAQTIGGNIASGTISGGGNLVKNGTGTLTVSSPTCFTGTTSVSGGMITLNHSLALSGSTLDTANSIASSSTSTGLKMGTGVTTLVLGGLSGDKNLASLFNAANGYSGITALTLNPGLGVSASYSGVIADGASGMTLTKTGLGNQTFSAAQSHTGSTTIQAGTLTLGANNVLPDASAVIMTGGTLDAATYTDTLSTLEVTGAATLNFGSGGSLVFADSSAQTWTGTLAITGTVGPTSLRFGTDNSALTQDQVSRITINGRNAVLTSQGYIVEVTGMLIQFF